MTTRGASFVSAQGGKQVALLSLAHLGDLQVDLCRCDARVPQQLLHSTQVRAGRQEVRRKGMAQDVRGDLLFLDISD